MPPLEPPPIAVPPGSAFHAAMNSSQVLVRASARHHEDLEVLGEPGDRGDVGQRGGAVVGDDPADHHGAGDHQRAGLAAHVGQLAQPDGAGGAGDVDHLDVVDDAVGLEGLLGLPGDQVPAAAGGGRGDQRQPAAGRVAACRAQRADESGGDHHRGDHGPTPTVHPRALAGAGRRAAPVVWRLPSSASCAAGVERARSVGTCTASTGTVALSRTSCAAEPSSSLPTGGPAAQPDDDQLGVELGGQVEQLVGQVRRAARRCGRAPRRRCRRRRPVAPSGGTVTSGSRVTGSPPGRPGAVRTTRSACRNRASARAWPSAPRPSDVS